MNSVFKLSKERIPNFNFISPDCVPNFEHELVKDVVGELDKEFKFIQSEKTGTDVYM